MIWEAKPRSASCSCCLLIKECCLDERRWGWVRSCNELEREAHCSWGDVLLSLLCSTSLEKAPFPFIFFGTKYWVHPALQEVDGCCFPCCFYVLLECIKSCLIISSWPPRNGTWDGKAAGPQFHLSTSQDPCGEWARMKTGASAGWCGINSSQDWVE